MGTKTIQLRELQADTEGYLSRCVDSGKPLLVKLADHRCVEIVPVQEDDDLINNLIEHNAAFRDLLARAAKSPSVPFPLLSSKKTKPKRRKLVKSK